MKFSSSLVVVLAASAGALPLVERQSKVGNSINQMTKGAVEFSPKFLSGNPTGVANAMGDIAKGAASFPFAFFSDLGKAASTIVKRDAPALSTSNSVTNMAKGATGFAPAFLAGDAKGVVTALGQMTGGAVSFAPGFFVDLGKAAGAVVKAPNTSGEKPATAPPTTGQPMEK